MASSGTNAAKPREWPTKARWVAEDVLAREVSVRAKARAAQEAIIAGNAHVAVILLADIREMSLAISEELGKALRGEYGE